MFLQSFIVHHLTPGSRSFRNKLAGPWTVDVRLRRPQTKWQIYFRNTGPSMHLDVSCIDKSRSVTFNQFISDSTSTIFQPFFLNFYKVHALAALFFIRMWNESGASKGDFPRLVALTRSQYVSRCSILTRYQSFWTGSRSLCAEKTFDRGTKWSPNSSSVNIAP